MVQIVTQRGMIVKGASEKKEIGKWSDQDVSLQEKGHVGFML